MRDFSWDSRLMEEETSWEWIWGGAWVEVVKEGTNQDVTDVLDTPNAKDIVKWALEFECKILDELGFRLYEDDLTKHLLNTDSFISRNPLSWYIYEKMCSGHISRLDDNFLKSIEIILKNDPENTIQIEKVLEKKIWWEKRWAKAIDWICMWKWMRVWPDKRVIIRLLEQKWIDISRLKY